MKEQCRPRPQLSSCQAQVHTCRPVQHFNSLLFFFFFFLVYSSSGWGSLFFFDCMPMEAVIYSNVVWNEVCGFGIFGRAGMHFN